MCTDIRKNTLSIDKFEVKVELSASNSPSGSSASYYSPLALPAFRLQKWYHFCAVNELVKGDLGDRYEMRQYLNGMPGEEGEASLRQTSNFFVNSLFSVLEGKFLQKGSFVVLGQEQDSPGGGFDFQQSFSGRLAQLLTLGRSLKADEVQRLANCTDEALYDNKFGMATWSLENVIKGKLELKRLCQEDIWLHQILLPRPLFYSSAKAVCEALGGQIPRIADHKTRQEYFEKQTPNLKDIYDQVGIIR